MIASVSIPLRSGIEISSSTTSQRSARNCFSASALDSASATTRISSVSSMMSRKPRRRIAWSSAMSTRIDSPARLRTRSPDRRGRLRHADGNESAARFEPAYDEGAAELGCAFFHSTHAEGARLQPVDCHHSVAVIGDGELDLVAPAPQPDADLARLRVFGDIGQHFAEDAEECRLGVTVETERLAWEIGRALHA